MTAIHILYRKISYQNLPIPTHIYSTHSSSS